MNHIKNEHTFKLASGNKPQASFAQPLFHFLKLHLTPNPLATTTTTTKKRQPLQIVTYRLLSLCLLSRGAKAGKGSRGEAFSNNDQPADLYTVTLSFHTLPKAVTMVGVVEVGPRGSSRQGRECHM